MLCQENQTEVTLSNAGQNKASNWPFKTKLWLCCACLSSQVSFSPDRRDCKMKSTKTAMRFKHHQSMCRRKQSIQGFTSLGFERWFDLFGARAFKVTTTISFCYRLSAGYIQAGKNCARQQYSYSGCMQWSNFEPRKTGPYNHRWMNRELQLTVSIVNWTWQVW